VDPELVLIEAVLPRRTQFSRRAVGKASAEQVIAANVDLAAVVSGLDGNFNLRRIAVSGPSPGKRRRAGCRVE
jgi:ribosome biogenesis GTPase